MTSTPCPSACGALACPRAGSLPTLAAWPAAATSQARRAGRFAWYTVADPRVADLVMLARSLAADNAAALAECVRIAPDPAGQPAALL